MFKRIFAVVAVLLMTLGFSSPASAAPMSDSHVETITKETWKQQGCDIAPVLQEIHKVWDGKQGAFTTTTEQTGGNVIEYLASTKYFKVTSNWVAGESASVCYNYLIIDKAYNGSAESAEKALSQKFNVGKSRTYLENRAIYKAMDCMNRLRGMTRGGELNCSQQEIDYAQILLQGKRI